MYLIYACLPDHKTGVSCLLTMAPLPPFAPLVCLTTRRGIVFPEKEHHHFRNFPPFFSSEVNENSENSVLACN